MSKSTQNKVKVVIGGVTGRMGRAAVRAILEDPQLTLCGGFASKGNPSCGEDLALLAGGGTESTGILVSNEIKTCLAEVKPDVYLDFTKAGAADENVKVAFEHGVSPVVGTSGVTPELFERWSKISKESGVPGLVVPNFSLGAVLMMEFAKQAAKVFNQTEIVELHHVGKVDAPSGTAMYTLQKMAAQGDNFNPVVVQEKELIPGSRGGKHDSGIRVHSMRLPGLISHQEVFFASEGELLTVRHDSFNTECFTKGILLALKQVRTLGGFFIGLENLLPGLGGTGK
ncbi:MAG TPA: 4-hydroxy-tetrahydrodipicolinate reductase [Oculatellaceae cyanobacterium]